MHLECREGSVIGPFFSQGTVTDIQDSGHMDLEGAGAIKQKISWKVDGS